MNHPLRASLKVVLLAVAAFFGFAGAAITADTANAESKEAQSYVAVARYTQDIVDAVDADKNHEVSNEKFLNCMSKEFDRLAVYADAELAQRPSVSQR